ETLKHLRVVARPSKSFTDRLAIVGAVQDVTEIKQTEAELRRANRHLMEAQILSKTGSFTWDVEADAHFWTEEERRIFEFEPETRITMPMILSAVHPDDMHLAEAAIGQATQAGEGFDVTFRIITKSGAVKHLRAVGTRAQVPNRLVYVGAVQ